MATSFVLGAASGFLLGVTSVDLHHDIYLLGDNLFEIVQTLEIREGRWGGAHDLNTVRQFYHRTTHSFLSRAVVIALGVVVLISGKRLLNKHAKHDLFEAGFLLLPVALAGLITIPYVFDLAGGSTDTNIWAVAHLVLLGHALFAGGVVAFLCRQQATQKNLVYGAILGCLLGLFAVNLAFDVLVVTGDLPAVRRYYRAVAVEASFAPAVACVAACLLVLAVLRRWAAARSLGSRLDAALLLAPLALAALVTAPCARRLARGFAAIDAARVARRILAANGACAVSLLAAIWRHVSKLREAPKCPICLRKMKGEESRATLKCGHHLHAACLKKLLHHGRCSCPICRAVIR